MKKSMFKVLGLLMALVMMLSLIPMAAAERGELPDDRDPVIVGSGNCGGEGDGSNLGWELDSVGNLTIYGIGTMGFDANAPWYAHRDSVRSVYIDSYVTSIADGAFNQCGNLEEITIPASVTEIGENAFSSCDNLKQIKFEGDAPAVETNAFDAAVATLCFAPGAEGWMDSDAYDGIAGTWNGYKLAPWAEIKVEGNDMAVDFFAAKSCKVMFVVLNPDGKFVKAEAYNASAGATEWSPDTSNIAVSQHDFKVLFLKNESSGNPWVALSPVLEYTGN